MVWGTTNMKTLIIYSHPNIQGYCSYLLELVEGDLKTKNVEYDLIDLYKINYDPVLHENELYSSGNHDISPQNLDFQEKIKGSNNIIIISPIWWASVPAILKGFFDKVFTSGFAFRYTKNGLPQKLLKEKNAVVFLTSGGPKIFFTLLGNPAKQMIKSKTLEFCGIKTKVYQIYKATKLDDVKKIKIEKLVKNGLNNLK